MPVISTFFGIVIRMFYKEHEPAHVFAEYQGQHATFTFTGEILAGEIPVQLPMGVQRSTNLSDNRPVLPPAPCARGQEVWPQCRSRTGCRFPASACGRPQQLPCAPHVPLGRAEIPHRQPNHDSAVDARVPEERLS